MNEVTVEWDVPMDALSPQSASETPAAPRVSPLQSMASNVTGAVGSLLSFKKPPPPKREYYQAPFVVPPVLNETRFLIFCMAKPGAQTPTAGTIKATTPVGPLAVRLEANAADYITGDLIHKMAARYMIRDLEEGTSYLHSLKGTASVTSDTIKSEIVRLGVQHQLASKHTSFVAVQPHDPSTTRVLYMGPVYIPAPAPVPVPVLMSMAARGSTLASARVASAPMRRSAAAPAAKPMSFGAPPPAPPGAYYSSAPTAAPAPPAMSYPMFGGAPPASSAAPRFMMSGGGASPSRSSALNSAAPMPEAKEKSKKKESVRRSSPTGAMFDMCETSSALDEMVACSALVTGDFAVPQSASVPTPASAPPKLSPVCPHVHVLFPFHLSLAFHLVGASPAGSCGPAAVQRLLLSVCSTVQHCWGGHGRRQAACCQSRGV